MSVDRPFAQLLNAERIWVFGMPICHMTHHAATQALVHEAERDGPLLKVFTGNTDHGVRLREDTLFREAYSHADAIFADGMPLIWTSRLMGRPLPHRVTGVDLFQSLCKEASVRGLSCFFLGATPEVLEEATAVLQAKYPSLKICGMHHGYFQDDEVPLRMIEEAKPAFLFVAMGSPRQELWIAANGHRLGCRVALAIGGSLDVIAGRVRRAPRLVQQMGMEWCWRMLSEPSRLWRRYLIDCPRILPQMARDILRVRFRMSAIPLSSEISSARKGHL